MAQISLGENRNPRANLAVIETIMNRASSRHTSLLAQMQPTTAGGYYPPSTFAGGRGANEAQLKMAYENMRRALGGSNISRYATDNSSQGLAYTERYGGAMGGYGRPGQRPGKFTFASEFGGRGGTGSPGMETFFSPGWGDAGPGGRLEKYRSWREDLAKVQKREDEAARNRLAIGEAAAGLRVEGGASLDVKIAAPPGAKVEAAGGGIFKKTNIERSVQMAPAHGGPPETGYPFGGT
jgi:hypothetical protein